MQVLEDFLDGPSFLTRSFVIEENERVACPAQERLQDGRRFMETTGIVAGVDEDLIPDRGDPQTLLSLGQEPVERLALILAGNERDQIQRVARRHPRIPVAKSVPRSVDRFQSLRFGCSVPRTTSVAPSWVRAKQSTCSGSAMARKTGEWVAQRIWSP